MFVVEKNHGASFYYGIMYGPREQILGLMWSRESLARNGDDVPCHALPVSDNCH